MPKSSLTTIAGNWCGTKWKYGYTLQNNVGSETSTDRML